MKIKLKILKEIINEEVDTWLRNNAGMASGINSTSSHKIGLTLPNPMEDYEQQEEEKSEEIADGELELEKQKFKTW